MAFNWIIKASNVWHNKCPKHLFTDMLYKGKQQQVKGGVRIHLHTMLSMSLTLLCFSRRKTDLSIGGSLGTSGALLHCFFETGIDSRPSQ